MRQAVWDVTAFVQSAGPGVYTVADIVFERAGAYLPYASWAIVAAYELDPGRRRGGDDARAAGPLRDRGPSRGSTASVVAVDRAPSTSRSTGSQVPVGEPMFGKTFHLAAHPQHRGADSLLFAGQPLGNNVSPGNSPPPLGGLVGTDPACNTTTSILNDSICELGAPVTTKTPGAADYLAAA